MLPETFLKLLLTRLVMKDLNRRGDGAPVSPGGRGQSWTYINHLLFPAVIDPNMSPRLIASKKLANSFRIFQRKVFAAKMSTVVLITGANQGLGFECVKKLAAEQPDYRILLASRNAERGREAANKVQTLANGTSIDPIELDVTNDDSIAKAAKYVESKYGHLDVLFNNAGIFGVPGASFREEFQKVLDTNVVGAGRVTEAFIPLLKKANVPRLLFMSSGFGSLTLTFDKTSPLYGFVFKAYNTSKAAMNMLGAMYAIELGKDGVKVNMIDPGFRSTNLNGYNEHGGDPADGALQAYKMIVNADKNGPHGTFTANEGPVPW